MGRRDESEFGTAPSLPVSRSFVVQFSGDTLISANRFAGRSEHIASGRCSRFATLDELIAFLTAVLAEAEREGEAD